jgi:hypothetical protein
MADMSGEGRDLGVPDTVSREEQYHPDSRGLIAVTNEADAEAFARTAGYVEVVAEADLPAPEPTHKRAAAATVGSATAGGSEKR